MNEKMSFEVIYSIIKILFLEDSNKLCKEFIWMNYCRDYNIDANSRLSECESFRNI